VHDTGQFIVQLAHDICDDVVDFFQIQLGSSIISFLELFQGWDPETDGDGMSVSVDNNPHYQFALDPVHFESGGIS
jgi:hypothetical protein